MSTGLIVLACVAALVILFWKQIKLWFAKLKTDVGTDWNTVEKDVEGEVDKVEELPKEAVVAVSVEVKKVEAEITGSL